MWNEKWTDNRTRTRGRHCGECYLLNLHTKDFQLFSQNQIKLFNKFHCRFCFQFSTWNTHTDAIRLHGSRLSDYERQEIDKYPEIWFLGLDACKINAKPGTALNSGYDDDNGSYNKVNQIQYVSNQFSFWHLYLEIHSYASHAHRIPSIQFKLIRIHQFLSLTPLIGDHSLPEFNRLLCFRIRFNRSCTIIYLIVMRSLKWLAKEALVK